ncbi:MAG TPA: alpha/beta hydrolase, partial [Candidatus Paceibacterota bacterium]|nr:alpha/beta hydrolase [Candidatus Paceibacterota bacterium]
ALTSLFLAAGHPHLIHSMVLAEPPAVSLLAHLPGPRADIGIETLRDIRANLVPPLTAAFRAGDREGGIRHFLAYMLGDADAWDRLSARSKAETLRNAGEWDVILTRGVLFPQIAPPTIRGIVAPTRLLSGEKSTRFLGLIDAELAALLPNSRRIVLAGATHQMWYDQPETCRAIALDLFQRSH